MEVELEMGLDGVSLTSPASSTVLASNSGACSTASADLDEDMLPIDSSDELVVESFDTDVLKRSVSCSTQQSPAYNELFYNMPMPQPNSV